MSNLSSSDLAQSSIATHGIWTAVRSFRILLVKEVPIPSQIHKVQKIKACCFRWRERCCANMTSPIRYLWSLKTKTHSPWSAKTEVCTGQPTLSDMPSQCGGFSFLQKKTTEFLSGGGGIWSDVSISLELRSNHPVNQGRYYSTNLRLLRQWCPHVFVIRNETQQLLLMNSKVYFNNLHFKYKCNIAMYESRTTEHQKRWGNSHRVSTGSL